MKKLIIYTLIAQVVSTVLALLTNAGVYTILVIYGIQTLLIVCLTIFETFKHSGTIGKVMAVWQGFIDVLIALALLAIIIVFNQVETIDVNGVPTNLNLGELSISAVILSSIMFLVAYVKDYRNRHIKKLTTDVTRTSRSFFVCFLYIVATFAVFIVALFINQPTGLVLVAIAAIKAILDVILILVEYGLQRIDVSFGKFLSTNTTSRHR